MVNAAPIPIFAAPMATASTQKKHAVLPAPVERGGDAAETVTVIPEAETVARMEITAKRGTCVSGFFPRTALFAVRMSIVRRGWRMGIRARFLVLRGHGLLQGLLSLRQIPRSPRLRGEPARG